MLNNHKQPLVSVVIPTCNRPILFERALKSVLKQKYDNFEIIIIDDGSMELVKDICDKYKNENLIYIVNKVNLGGAESRNIGINISNGKYIAFLDDDDVWLPHKINKQVKLLESNNNIVAVTSWFYHVIGNHIIKRKMIHNISYKHLLWTNFCGGFSLCMVRNKCAKKIIIEPTLKKGQDWYFWSLLSKLGSIKVIPDYLIKFYDHGENRISNINYHIALRSQRKIYFHFNKDMSSECRQYHLRKFIFKRILYSKQKKMRKISKLIRLFILPDKIKVHILIKMLLIKLSKFPSFYYFDPRMNTFSFINNLSENSNNIK